MWVRHGEDAHFNQALSSVLYETRIITGSKLKGKAVNVQARRQRGTVGAWLHALASLHSLKKKKSRVGPTAGLGTLEN